MANRKKPRRKSGRLTTLLVMLIAGGLICFVGYTLIGGMVQRTAVVAAGSIGNKYAANAVVVRNEKVTDTEGLTTVKFYADEGELLYPGTKIADVYSSGYSQTDINKLLNTRTNIKTHVVTALASGSYMDTQLERLDATVMDYARELGLLVQGNAAGNLINLERQLTTALSQRQSHMREKYYSSDPTLARLYDDETSLVKKIQSWTTPFLSTSTCIISFYTDDYETTLDTAVFDDITMEQVKGVLAGERPQMSSAQRGRTALFREITPTGYGLLLLSSDKNWNPVDGQTYQVSLSGYEDVSISGVITSSTRNGNELLVRMWVDGDVKPLLNTRTAQAQVSETYAIGLQVPVGALYRQNGQEGVVLTDGDGWFVAVTVLMRDNSIAVVQPLVAGTLQEGQRIRLFN